MQWFVRAIRHKAEISIPATNRNFASDDEQQLECQQIHKHLEGHGWTVLGVEAY